MANRNWAKTMGAALLVTLGVLANQAGAVPLAPGGAVATPGTTAAARPELAGVVVQDVIRPISVVVGGTVIRGWQQDRIVRSNQSGSLDFYYRINIDQGSNGGIVQVRKADFSPAAAPTDVDWRIDGLGLKNPKAAARSASGQIVVFEHAGGNAILPGQQSRFVFVKTRAKTYKVGTTMLRWISAGGAGVVVIPTFQPSY